MSLKSGTTTFADQYWHMDRVASAVQEAGLRADLSQGILELGDSAKGQRDLEGAARFAKKWNNQAGGRITCRLGLHSIYSCSPKLLQDTRAAANEMGVGIHIHVAEVPNEVKMSKEKHGETSIQHLNNLNFLKGDILAAHCVFVNERDMEIMKSTNTAVAHCPSAMMKYGNEAAPIPELVKKGVTVGLGTDGCGSNNNLDLIEEMRTAALLHKANKRDSTVLPASQLIRMSTIDGAKALGLDSKIGSVEEGKRADLILLNFRKPHLVPCHNIPGILVYSAFGSDVDTMIVDGKIIMKNRQVLTLDEEKILKQAQTIFEKLLDKGGYSTTLDGNPKPSLKTKLTVKSLSTLLGISQMIKSHQ